MTFQRDGFEVRPLFEREEIAGLQAAIGGYMDRLSATLNLPLEQSAPDAPFDERIERIAAKDPSYANLLGAAVCTDAHRGPEFMAIAEDRRLVEAAEALIGRRVTDRTVRIRGNSTAMGEHRHAWHSDVATLGDARCQIALTAWIPLCDIRPETGGLEIAHGLRPAPLPHERIGNRAAIDGAALEADQKTSIRCDMGSVVLMDRFTPHRSAPNTSGKTRWSLVVWMKTAASSAAVS